MSKAMYIESFHIESFKAIGDATFHWHPRVNILTGSNNSGKTTALEALALWVECFDRMSDQSGQYGKAVTKRGLRRGDRSLDGVLVHHSEIVSVRSPEFDDLFNRDSDVLRLTARVIDTVEGEREELAICVQIKKARSGHYELSCPESDTPAFNARFNGMRWSWPRPVRVFFASPVAAVRTQEEFQTPGKRDALIRERRSAEVLRNRIARLHPQPAFQTFKDQVGLVLTGRATAFDLEVRGDPNKDVFVRVLARTNENEQLRDISLLGSGSLQIIEVLLNFHLDDSDKLSLVLLDEPDSHIHRDIQRRLLDTLERLTDNAQVFATTHNEALLRSAGWDRVFHLQPAPAGSPREFRAVGSEQLVLQGRKHGLLASPLRGAMSSIGAETALDLLNALESRHFFMVEGSSDALLFERMFEVGRLGTPRETAMYWSLNGIDNGLRGLPAVKVVLQQVRNDRSLWDKAHLILDRDWLTDAHAQQVAQKLSASLGLRTSFWAARTVEACLLSGGASAALASVVRRVLAAAHQRQVSEADAHAAVVGAWTALGERLRKRFSEELQLTNMTPAIEQRKQLLDDVLPKHKPLPGPIGGLLDEIIAFHRASVAAGHLWQTADKQDVAAFVAEVFTSLGLADTDASKWVAGPSWFGAVVGEITQLQDFPALAAMWTAR